jgi:hypothetical protein
MVDKNRIDQFAFQLGILLGQTEKILEDKEIVEHFLKRGVTVVDLKNLQLAISHVSRAFYYLTPPKE